MIKRLLLLVCSFYATHAMNNRFDACYLNDLKRRLFEAITQHPSPEPIIEVAQKFVQYTGILPRYKDNQNPLHLLCRNCNELETIEKLIKIDPTSLNQKDDYGFAPIHYACLEGNETIISLLLRNCANPNNQTSRGWTPLHYACVNNQTELTSLLLDHQANPKLPDDHGITPGMLAEQHKARNPQLLDLIIRYTKQHEGEESQ